MDFNSNPRIALFASGLGSNALALLHHDFEVLKSKSIIMLICDKIGAPIIESAKKYPIQICVIPKEKGESRESHEEKILRLLRVQNINWVFLAGYLRILTQKFIDSFRPSESDSTRMINIHPSLLPAYQGLHAYERAFQDGVMSSGVTVHYVDPVVDAGEVILQESFSRLSDDTLQSFIERGKTLEHKLYCQVLDMLINHQLLPQEQL